MTDSMNDIALRILEGAISRARGDRQYQVDRRISPLSMATISFRKAMGGVRGISRKPFFRDCGTPLFVGRHVSFYHPGHISFGSGCSISDYAMIDGLSSEGIVIGNNVTLERYAAIRATGTLRNLGVGVKIGDNSSLGAFSFIGAAGGVVIGDDVMMGPLVGIYAENHEFDGMDLLIREQGVSRTGVRIGSNCWIGAGVAILDGVTIGDGCVVGAGSIVSRDLEPDTVSAGSPARVVRKRGQLK